MTDGPRRKEGLTWLAGALVLLVGTSLPSCGARRTAVPREPGPYGLPGPGTAAGLNVLLVTLDTTRADHIGCYGATHARTPTLDGLAATGLRYASAFTAAPVTLPSHATILTGLIPPHHGVRHNVEYRLPRDIPTLATRLADAGYDTAAFVSAFVLDARFGLHRGFRLYDDGMDVTEGGAFAAGTNERAADATTDAAAEWLGRRREAPFFAWVHYFDPHAPYRPPTPFAAPFESRPYDGEIAFVDAELGRLLRQLESLGQAGRTVVVVVGDHGESLGEHGELTHGLFVYDAVMRVPLLLNAPSLVRRPEVIQELVATADITPTLLDLLGISGGEELDGISWASSTPDGSRGVYLESLVPYLDYGWAPLVGIRRAAHKYIEAPRPEYYDLAADPRERANLLETPAKAPRREIEELRHALREARDTPARPGSREGDPEANERLRALGYGGTGPEQPISRSDLPDPKDRVEVVAALLEANRLLATGRPREALALLEEVQRVSPRDRSVLHGTAKAALRLGLHSRAERALRAFREIRPKADASLLLAQILILDGRVIEAQQLLDEAATLDARHGGVFIARGDIHLRAGRMEEARVAYDEAARVDPYRAAGAARARVAALERKAPVRPR